MYAAKHLIFYLALLLGRILLPVRFLLDLLGRVKGVTLLSPSPPGNLGDEAMMSSACRAIENRHGKPPRVIVYLPEGQCVLDGNELPTLALTGRSTIGTFLCFLRHLRDVCSCRSFSFVGGDTLDGYYSPHRTLVRLALLSLYANAGVRSTILGFSFNTTPDTLTTWAWRRVPRSVTICTRDALSQDRLETILNRPVHLTADMAFLLEPAKTSATLEPIRAWLEEKRANGTIAIGINANALFFQQTPGAGRCLEAEIFSDAIATLSSQLDSACFILIAHDFRTNSDDLRLMHLIEETLPEKLKDACRSIPGPLSAAEIKLLAGELDVVISSRMHLSIACLGQGTPVLGISYQDKFDGLYLHFGLKALVIDHQKIADGQGLADAALAAIHNRDNVRSHILGKLENVRELSLKNFDTL